MTDSNFIERLEKLAQRKAILDEQVKQLTVRKEELLSQLVAQYGEDWEAKYQEALKQVEEWEKQNAAS